MTDSPMARQNADGEQPHFRVDFDRFHDTRDLPPPVAPASSGTTEHEMDGGDAIASPSLIDVNMCL
jgi:hypothetical protein